MIKKVLCALWVQRHGKPEQLSVVAARLNRRVQVADEARQDHAYLRVQAPLLASSTACTRVVS